MRRIFLLLALAALPAFSQAPPAAPPSPAPNAAGVFWLHIHLYVRDVDAQRAFWVALGGDGPAGGRGVRFGQTTVSITKGEPSGGNEGSAIDHAGFRVKDLKDTLAKVEAAGGKILPGARPNVAFVTSPEGVKVELIADSSLTQAIVPDHVQLLLPSAAAAFPWYEKVLGATAASRPRDWLVPGIILRVTEGNAAPTSKGRSLDHIAFDVGNLTEFCKRLDGMSIKSEPITKLANGTRGYTYISDPNGVYIELMGVL